MHLCTKLTEKSRKDSSKETYIVEPEEKCAGPNQGNLCFWYGFNSFMEVTIVIMKKVCQTNFVAEDTFKFKSKSDKL